MLKHIDMTISFKNEALLIQGYTMFECYIHSSYRNIIYVYQQNITTRKTRFKQSNQIHQEPVVLRMVNIAKKA